MLDAYRFFFLKCVFLTPVFQPLCHSLCWNFSEDVLLFGRWSLRLYSCLSFWHAIPLRLIIGFIESNFFVFVAFVTMFQPLYHPGIHSFSVSDAKCLTMEHWFIRTSFSVFVDFISMFRPLNPQAFLLPLLLTLCITIVYWFSRISFFVFVFSSQCFGRCILWLSFFKCFLYDVYIDSFRTSFFVFVVIFSMSGFKETRYNPHQGLVTLPWASTG